jgi:phage gp29-like protein
LSARPRIVGPDGRPVSAERVKLEKQTRFNPLRSWTPDVLVRQLEAYSRGEIAALAWVMEWLEKHDDIIATVAPKAKAAVSRWGYDVLPKDEIGPELKAMADDQQGTLQEFFQSLQTSDAVELEETGCMRLLVSQIMDAYGKGYAAHHIVWRPGKTEIRAELVKVPTWFFEVTDGRMKFLPAYAAQRGVELETLGGRNAWACYRGRGVMLAGCLARMFKQLPLQDWLTYCDRHGMPAFLGKTAAQKGTTGWNDMADAVAGMGAEFGAVINQGDVIDVLSLASQGEVPYAALIDRMDRAQIMLWRGGDLSTMSRENGTGSNPQNSDTDELDADNAEWVSECVNRNLTNRVVAWAYGPQAPVLCSLKLRTKTRDNLTQDIQMVEKGTAMGVRISRSWFTNKFGLVEAAPEETALGETAPGVRMPAAFQPPAPAAFQTAAINTAAGGDVPAKMDALREALAADMKPLGDALYAAYQAGDEAAVTAALRKISKSMPDYLQSAGMEAHLQQQFVAAIAE